MEPCKGCGKERKSLAAQGGYCSARCAERRDHTTVGVIAGIAVVAFIVLALAYSALAQERTDKPLVLGTEDIYAGIYCDSQSTAEYFFDRITLGGENTPVSIPHGCMTAAAPVRYIAVVRQATTSDTDRMWSIVKARVKGADAPLYILTGLPVLKGQPI